MKKSIKDYIKVFDNKFFSEKQCQLIIKSLDSSKNKTNIFYRPRTNEEVTVGNDPQVSFLKDKKIKPMGTFITDQWYKIITEYIVNWLDKKEKMSWYNGWNGSTFPKFMKYKKGNAMDTHCDHIHQLFVDNGKPRGIPTLSIITALNDNYSGGEIVMCEDYEYKLKAGETIMFPSNFLYPHSIKKITKGTRYSMVSWVH